MELHLSGSIGQIQKRRVWHGFFHGRARCEAVRAGCEAVRLRAGARAGEWLLLVGPVGVQRRRLVGTSSAVFVAVFALTVPGRLTEVVAHRMALWSAAFPRLLLTDHTCAAHGNHLVEGQVLLEDMDCISQLYGAAAMLRA